MKQPFDPDKFNKFMISQADIIRNSSFDHRQIIRVIDNIRTSLEIWKSGGSQEVKDLNLMAESLFYFNLSLEIAYSNYRKENKNLWSTVFGWGVSKVPQINIREAIKNFR